ncbi:hypothetical protein GQ54DRAFT_39319 [Martensiomyces pterosporus]|nr:hypothetical protein GQ54DRAFT_39319 [Martensiomyces pterosporus]
MTRMALNDTSPFHVSDAGETIRLIVVVSALGIYAVSVVATTAVLLYRHLRCRGAAFAKGPMSLIACQAVLCLFVGVLSLTATALREYPCALKIWVLYFGVPLWLATVAVRALQRYILFKVPSQPQQQQQRFGVIKAGLLSRSAARSTASARPALCASTHSTPYRPGTGTTLDLWSEFEYRDRGSCSSAPDHYEACAMLSRQTRYRRYMSTRTMLCCLALLAGLLAAAAIVVNTRSPRYDSTMSVQSVCSNGWELWLAYSFSAIFVAVLFPVLIVLLLRVNDPYGARTDILICMLAAQICLVLSVLWQTKLASLEHYLSDLAIVWLGMLVTHVSSVAWPLLHAKTHCQSLSAKSSQVGVDNSYKGAQLRRSIYTSLYKEFHQMLENGRQRHEFLAFVGCSYCSALPSFLSDFQALKYRTIDALKQAQFAQHAKCRISRPHKLHAAASSPAFAKAHTSSTSPILRAATQDLLLPGACRSQGSNPMAALVPVTVGILESAMRLLPPGSVSQSTHFPEAVKIAFARFVSKYFCKDSYMSINIPGEVIDQVRVAVESNSIVLSVLDRAKDEVLFLLCTDVYASYRRRLEPQTFPTPAMTSDCTNMQRV